MTDTPPRRFVFPLGLAVLALLFAAFMWGGLLIEPAPVRTTNPAGAFDARSAEARLARILGDETPHPVDSAAQDVVRERLLAEIRALGFTPEVREHFTCLPQPSNPVIDCALVRNILFSAGPADGPAILAATHYDSVSAGPGAGDAGIGVAVWLELAGMLRNAPLERRIIFLISDGEEQALLGAYAFAQNGGMDGVEALVNLEARGTRGPAVFFESNQPNADAVAAFAQAPRGIANSVMADIYAMLPNSTDVTVLTRPGLDVVNIALLEGLENYHTPQDSLASFSAASAQHMGDAALVTTRALAMNADRGDATPRVYTDIASRLFVSAPVWAGQAALGVSLIVCVLAFWRVGKEGRWRAFAAPLVLVLIAAALSAAIGVALSAVRAGETYWFAQPEWTRAWCALAALIAAPLTLMLMRVRDGVQLGAAGLLWFTLLGFAASLFLPGVSILFAIPAAAYAIFALISFVWAPARAIGTYLAAVLALAVWAPMLFLFELALGFDLPLAIAALMALVAVTWLGAIAAAQREVRWRGSTAVLAAGLIAVITGAGAAPASSTARPMPINLNYFVDVDAGEARILAGGAARRLPPAIAAAADFDPHLVLPGDRFPTWAAPAAFIPAPAPSLAELVVSESADGRVLRARLEMNGAYRATVRMPRASAPLSATVNGVLTSFADTGAGVGDFVSVACQGRACDGASIEIAFDGDSPLGEWFVIGQTPGAEAAPASALRAARPANTTPIQFGDTTVTLRRVAVQ